MMTTLALNELILHSLGQLGKYEILQATWRISKEP